VEEEEAEEEVSKGGVIMTLLWWGLLDAALLTFVIGSIVGWVRVALRGTFNVDQFLGALPWLIVFGVGAFFVSWIFVRILKTSISTLRKSKNEAERD
jgi:hypothetical protein